MFASPAFFNFLVIFAVFNGCQACFLHNEHESISITTGSVYYKECTCTEPGYSATNLRWLNNNNQPIEPLPSGPDTRPNVYTEVQRDSINLHISSITKSASGTYTCVTEVNGIVYSQSYTIAAYEPLYFYETPLDQFLVDGNLSPIKCQPKSDTTVVMSWQKGVENPIEISNDDKYFIGNDGLYINNVTKDDAGDYKCTAQVIVTNEEVDIYIKVKVETVPAVKELVANPETSVVVGTNLSINCNADGTHLQYLWNKTEEAGAQGTYNATWHQFENSILFYSIKPEDRGLYTCYAFNYAGFAAEEIFVEVLTPPKVTYFPNITVVEGHTIQLVCNATGRSEPNITITYEGRDLNSNIDLIIRENIPNMAFIHIERSTEGIYVCEASNEVQSIQEAMYLTVLHQPYFDKRKERVWGWDGKTINLSCIQDSNPRADISWRFQGNDIRADQEIEINKKLQQMIDDISDPYVTLNIDNETAYGDYVCTAKNRFGEAMKIITLKEGFKPKTVQNASVVDLTATSVTFDIVNPENDDDHGPAVLGFTATYDEAKNYNTTDIHINRTWSIDRPFKLDKLKPNTTYYVKFAALNEVGRSGWSEYLTFNTLDKSVPEPPEWDEEPIELATGSHVLKWKAPDDNGEPIDYYTLRYCQEQDEGPCKTQRVSSTTELELADLEFNTTYFMELVAHNAEGDSTAANISVIVPAPNLASPSTQLSSGAIIGVSIVIVVLCLLLLDVLLLTWRRQGIIATCCYKKDNKRKESSLNPRDKKGLLTNGETTEEARPGTRPNNGHKEFQYNKNTGVVTGKHSAV